MVTQSMKTGLIVYWTLSEWTDRERLKAGWLGVGLGDAVPEPRANTSCLKDALTEVMGGTRFLVRPLSTRTGFTVVREDRGEEENGYAPVLTAKVYGDFLPVITGDQSKAEAILDAYRRHAGRIGSPQMSAALVRVLDGMGGIRLRPSGGIYWLPGDREAQWEAASRAAEEAAEGGRTACYLHRPALDPDSVAAVRDAIVQEVSAEAKRIGEEILSGEIGVRAVETRKKEAAALKRKVAEYEAILDVGLDHLKRTLDSIEQSNATAALLLAADPWGQNQEEVSHVPVLA